MIVFILPLACFRNTSYLCHPTLPQCHHKMVSVQKTYNTGGRRVSGTYCVGQKVRLGFSVRPYGKTQMNFFGQPNTTPTWVSRDLSSRSMDVKSSDHDGLPRSWSLDLDGCKSQLCHLFSDLR